MAEAVLAVPLPHMGVSVQEATVVARGKAGGDEGRAEEPLCDISTDKVDTEIVSPADGVLARIVAEIGDTVAVGATLAELAAGAPLAESPVGPTHAETPVGATLAETPVGATHAETPVGTTHAETPVGAT